MKEAVGGPHLPPSEPVHGVIRFGNFEVDTRAGELRRGGIRIKLTGQPFEVLVALLERPGQVVTREVLHQKLWSQDTFVDFEHGLNKAINKVREALGDDADNPRFIETLPRRGYRFLPSLTLPEVLPVDRTSVTDQTQASSQPPSKHRARRIWAIAFAGAAILLGIAVLELIPTQLPRVLRVTQLTHDGLSKGTGFSARLATDGSRIYFSERDSSEHAIIGQVSVNGGTVSPVAEVPMSGAQLDYSPVRSELLAHFGIAGSPLWVMDVPGESALRRVGDVMLDDAAAWSPDGQSIVFSHGSDLFRVKADGSDRHKLATLKGFVDSPRWSPDGKRIVFTVVQAYNIASALWEIAADGSDPHPVFPDSESKHEDYGALTPDGKYVVFIKYLPANVGEIFAARMQKEFLLGPASKPVQLTSEPMSFTSPTLSPDGKRIFAIGGLNQGELMHYDVDTRQWKPYLSGISAADADFSRDGEWVTYVLIPEGTLWRSRVDGSQRAQLTIPPFRTALPRWSPDGKQIAFMGRKPGGTWAIYLTSADGGEAEQLTTDNASDFDPNWSADGKQLVFGDFSGIAKAIHIFDLQSHRVTDLPDSAGLFSPRWSPDGRYICALSSAGVPSPAAQTTGDQRFPRLMLFDLALRKWTLCCEAPGMEFPSFSHDSKYVYFSHAGASVFYRVRLGENKIETVAKIDVPGGMKWDDLWYWGGLAPDGSPLVMRDASTQEIYALDLDSR